MPKVVATHVSAFLSAVASIIALVHPGFTIPASVQAAAVPAFALGAIVLEALRINYEKRFAELNAWLQNEFAKRSPSIETAVRNVKTAVADIEKDVAPTEVAVAPPVIETPASVPAPDQAPPVETGVAGDLSA
jgi:P pilus assembly chaperone PapD